MGLGKVAQRHRQRPDMVVMAMGDGDGVHLFLLDQVVERQGAPAFEPGMGAGIHQQPMPLHFDKPGRGADVCVRVEVEDLHFIWP